MQIRTGAAVVAAALGIAACGGDDAGDTTTTVAASTTAAPATTSAGPTATTASQVTVPPTEPEAEATTTTAAAVETSSTSPSSTEVTTETTAQAGEAGDVTDPLSPIPGFEPIVDPETGLTITDLNYYVAEDGAVYWAAAMVNPSDVVIDSPTVDIAFFDEAGTEVGVSGDFTGYVGPGAVFALTGSAALSGPVAQVDAEPYAFGTLDPGSVQWELPAAVTESSTNAATGETVSRGTVTNPNTFDIETWVYVVFTTEDGSHIVDAEYAAYSVPAGETVEFEITSYKYGAELAPAVQVVATWNALTELPA